MKAGDYMIHVSIHISILLTCVTLQVFVEVARQLKVPEGNTVDPLLEVSIMGEKKFTTAKDDVGATGVCVWNEHLFFEPKGVVSTGFPRLVNA